MNETYKTPGQLIEALLKEKGWSQAVLAHVLEWDASAVNRLISDKRVLDAPTAILLEEVFSVAAERFLELQKNFDLASARIKARPNSKRATRAQLFGDLPIPEMIRRGWISATDIRDENLEPELARFFKSNRVEDIEILPHAAKKTEVSVDASPSQLAWLYRVRQIAQEMLVGKYSQAAVQGAVQKLKALLSSPEEARKVPRILAEAGIRFVIVETLPTAKIDGVCFWLNDVSPVIGMTMRFDRIDNFWFVLRHELEHVLQLHGRI
ncbi:MAG: helix-turn-helix domain-containing protein, partial [Aestuariivirga sp.]